MTISKKNIQDPYKREGLYKTIEYLQLRYKFLSVTGGHLSSLSAPLDLKFLANTKTLESL